MLVRFIDDNREPQRFDDGGLLPDHIVFARDGGWLRASVTLADGKQHVERMFITESAEDWTTPEEMTRLRLYHALRAENAAIGFAFSKRLAAGEKPAGDEGTKPKETP